MPSGNDEQQRILRARAAALARVPEESGAEGDRIEIVEFSLASERYAIESAYIGAVHPLKELTPLPCTPSFVLGVINLRGQILSIIDLREFFDLPERGVSGLSKVIVLRSDSMEFGLLADAVIEARWIPRSTLRPALPTLTDVREEYLLGVTQERLVVLDGGRILSDRGFVVHEEV
ncbi:MAG: chemotaxis protein CheW [Desulfobacteraceae bacterium]|nr:chemotaxis protein CheW [Desulfobacteraceae bacterium]